MVGQGLIDRAGWRVSYALLGAAALLVAVPGDAALSQEPSHSKVSSIQNQTSGLGRREAIRSEIFWVLMIVFFLVSAIVQACQIHLSPLLTDRGISAQRAALHFIAGAANLIGRLGTGWLLESFPGDFSGNPLIRCDNAGNSHTISRSFPA